MLWVHVLGVHIGALVNDTVATLAAVCYVDGSNTVASVIMGTGVQYPKPQTLIIIKTTPAHSTQ